MGHLTALKDLRQKGFVIPGSDGTVNLGAYSEAAEKLWRKARAEAKAAKTKEAPGSPPGVHPASTHHSGIRAAPQRWQVHRGDLGREAPKATAIVRNLSEGLLYEHLQGG